MEFLKQTWVWLTSSMVFVLALMRSLFVVKIRIRGQEASGLFDMLKAEGKAFVFEEEICTAGLPKQYKALCCMHWMLFFLQVEERLLRAGQEGTDNIVYVTALRFQHKKMMIHLSSLKPKTKECPVYVLMPWDAYKIGQLKIPDEISEPYLDLNQYADVKQDIERVLAGDTMKTGAIVYGPPGNGKSYLVRYFALKYGLPVYIVAFIPSMDNHDIIRMFSRIRGPALILFEDFDSHFEGRKCLIQDAKFTFDVLLNVLDGVYSTPESLIFMMTVNEIKVVDSALRARPSRFRFVKHIGPPSADVRMRIFENQEITEATDGLSLDMALFVQDRLSIGYSLERALRDVKMHSLEEQGNADSKVPQLRGEN